MSGGEINTDRAWVLGLKAHNEAAFRHVWDAYRDDVYTYAYSFVKRRAYAEEIVQEVFLKIWIHREELSPDYSFKSYLFTITRNHTLNFLRKAAHNRQLREEIFHMVPDCINCVELKIQELEMEKIKREAVDLLPPGRKRIFEMSRFEGKSYEEISRELGISLSTVRNQMSKSLQTIRDFLKAQGVTPWLVLLMTWMTILHGCML